MAGSADGVILYDKPAGITSHDVVARVRGLLGPGVKVRHAGTLDPFATRPRRARHPGVVRLSDNTG